MTQINALLLAIALMAGASGQAFAEDVDLSKVDRSIRREPVWKSGEPRYCLFVILKGDAWDSVIPGETELGLSVVSTERRVWFVLDGDDLYMDIHVKEFHLQKYITGPYQTANARLPEEVDDEGT